MNPNSIVIEYIKLYQSTFALSISFFVCMYKCNSLLVPLISSLYVAISYCLKSWLATKNTSEGKA